MFEQLNEVIRNYQTQMKDSTIKFQPYEKDDDIVSPFILVILTEQMKRIHELVSIIHTLLLLIFARLGVSPIRNPLTKHKSRPPFRDAL